MDINQQDIGTIKSENTSISYPHPTELMGDSANQLFRIPVFLSHPNRLNETPLTNIRRMILSSYGMVALNLRQRRVNIIENNLNQPIGTTV